MRRVAPTDHLVLFSMRTLFLLLRGRSLLLTGDFSPQIMRGNNKHVSDGNSCSCFTLDDVFGVGSSRTRRDRCCVGQEKYWAERFIVRAILLDFHRNRYSLDNLFDIFHTVVKLKKEFENLKFVYCPFVMSEWWPFGYGDRLGL